MKPPERLETQRLQLRQPKLEDAEPLFQKYTRDPEVTKYLSWQPHETLQETEDFLQRSVQSWSNASAFPWVIIRKSDGELMGMIEARIDGHAAMVGYVLARAYWNQGYMSEALRAVTEWGIAQPKIYRVWAVCDTENPASARVMENAGMQREGILRRYLQHPNINDIPRDCYCYALIK